MIQVQPREKIPLVYLVGDTTDLTGYYVRAVLRDSLSGAVISSATLVQDATLTRRYTGVITAPDDSTGQGRWIDITIGVYSDAGFASYASIYPEQVFSYVVQRRISAALLAAGATSHGPDMGAAGPDIDYKRIGKMVQDLGKVLSTEIQAAKVEIPEQKEMDQEALILRLVEAIATLLTPHHIAVHGKLDTALAEIGSTKSLIPEIQAAMKQDLPDFEPVFKRFEDLGLSHEEVINAVAPAVNEIVHQILTKHLADLGQSTQLLIPQVVREALLHNGANSGGTGEPPVGTKSRKGARDYHADAMLLLGLHPNG